MDLDDLSSELEAMERDARCALFFQNHQFQIAVPDYQRQARDAVSKIVRASSESYEVVMLQENSRYPKNRNEERMEEHERRVAHVIGPKHQKLHVVKEAMRYKNIQYSFKQEQENKVREKPDALGATVAQRKLSKILA